MCQRIIYHFSLLLILLSISVQSTASNEDPKDGYVTTHVAKAGTLDSLWGEDIKHIKCLTLSGNLNGADIKALQRVNYQLESLDMQDACIVAGGGEYKGYYSSWDSYTHNFEITHNMFGKSRKLKSIILPKRTRGVHQYSFYDCAAIESCVIPSTELLEIEAESFSYKKIRRLSLSSAIPPRNLNREAIADTVFIPVGSLKAYERSGEWLDMVLIEDPGLIIDKETSGQMLKNIKQNIYVRTPGTLKDLLGDNISEIEYLTLRGTINSTDMKTFKKMSVKLRGLSMGEVEIVGSHRINQYTSVGMIPFRTFEDFRRLESVVLPNDLLRIENGAFKYCRSLKSIVIPETVESIASNAFDGCSSLKSVTFKGPVAEIAEDAFDKYGIQQQIITHQTEVLGGNKHATDKFRDGDDMFRFLSRRSNYTLHVPKGAKDTFVKGDTGGAIIDIVEEESLVPYIGHWPTSKNFVIHLDEPGTLSDKLGADVLFVERLNLSGTLNSDDLNTINRTRKTLESIDLLAIQMVDSTGEASLQLGDYLFYKFAKLKDVKLPNKLEAIGASMFENCTALTSVDIPHTLNAMGDRAFSNCKSLVDIDLSCNIAAISKYAFYHCESLQSVLMPPNLETIEEYAFINCIALTSIDIPNSVTRIGRAAFCNTGLQSIIIPDNVTLLSPEAFRGAKSLKSAVLSNRMRTIEYRAFYNCISLDSIILPASIRNINDEAFYECKSLNDLEIRGNLVWIGKSAFTLSPLRNIRNYGDYAFRFESDIFYAEPKYYQFLEKEYTRRSQEQRDEQKLRRHRTMYVSLGKKKEYQISGVWKGVSIKEDKTRLVSELPYDHFYKTLNLDVKQAGTLDSLLNRETSLDIEKLVLSGYLNGSDFRAIERVRATLLVLDMGKANTVKGGDAFFTDHHAFYGEDRILHTQDNVIWVEMFNPYDLVSLTLPSTTTDIRYRIASHSSRLSGKEFSINIPRDLEYMTARMLYYFGDIGTIRSEKAIPISLTKNRDVLDRITKSRCRLYIPVGSKKLYEDAYGWMFFKQIIEDESLNKVIDENQDAISAENE